MNSFSTYQQELIKPDWAPSAYVFGPVWTILYFLIVFSFARVFLLLSKKKIAFVVALPFILNVIFNIAFTPLQFGIKSNILACIDIFLVLGTLIWAMISIYKYDKVVTYLQIPYLLWVSFATVLQVTITYLNW